MDHKTGATIYVDNYSGLKYSHLQFRLDNNQTIQSNLSFVAHPYNMGINTKAYWAENGQFLEKVYRESVSDTFSYNCHRKYPTQSFINISYPSML